MSYHKLGKPARRLADITPLEMDLRREVHDAAEEARFQVEQEAREPRQDPGVDPDYTDWLTDTEDAA